MTPRFDERLNTNFNHLVFVDDLIIITRAPRIAARNCKLCPDIYSKLIGQQENPDKSTTIWGNSRVSSAIKTILGMKLGSFLFKYLGGLISPKRLLVH